MDGGGGTGVLWWNAARGTSSPGGKFPRGMFMFMTGLLAVAVGERGVLVLPVMAQDGWPTGEPWSMTLGGERGVRVFPWMEAEPGLPAPGNPQGLVLGKLSGLPRVSAPGDCEPSPYSFVLEEGGLSMPP